VADNIGYTPGTGALIKTDQGSGTGAHMVVAKIAESADGGENLVPATATNGLAVDVTRVQGTVTVSGTVTASDGGGTVSVDDGSGSLTVDGTVTVDQGTAAPVSAPWPVKISDGTLPVTVKQVDGEGALRVAVVHQSGASVFNDASQFVEGSSQITAIGGVYSETPDTSLTEDAAAALRLTAYRGLHVNLRDASGNEAGSASYPLRVDPVGTTPQPVSGTVTATLPATTNAGATAKILNYNTGAGTDNITAFGLLLPSGTGAVAGGTATAPLRVDPTGGTTQPISGTVTANQGTANATPWNQNLAQVGGASVATVAAGVQKVGVTDSAGGAIAHSNPLEVALSPSADTNWRMAKTYGASETSVAIQAPSGGKTLVVCGLIITATASGSVRIFDNSESDSTVLYRGTVPAGVTVINFATPQKLSAANNVLRYSTGAAAAGEICAYGYEI
jgi:hypothetical protein